MRFRTHGLSQSSTYSIWEGMIQRCTNKNCAGFSAYGGSGIHVCSEWMSFDRFYQDMGLRPPGLSLERKDGTKGYNKENCQWATKREQSLNRRSTRWFTINGETLCLKDWVNRYGMDSMVGH